MTKLYNKLVRDKIPEIIKQRGGHTIVRRASSLEFRRRLLDKIVEEAGELRDAKDRKSRKEELADILEVLDEIYAFEKINLREIKALQKKKAIERGRFKERIILIRARN